MSNEILFKLFASASLAFVATHAVAQNDGSAGQPENLTPVEQAPLDAVVDTAPTEATVIETTAAGTVNQELADEATEGAGLSEDEIADMLNSQQQLKQTFTLKRTINGNVVETEKRTVTFSRNQPYRETEAGQSALEAVKAAFDGELLTRVEAFEEAKIDFVIADVNRDGVMTSQEFAALVDSWRENDARQAVAPTKDVERQRQYEALLEEINPEAAEAQNEAYAKEKFAFLSGAAETVTREDYIREYLLDFDSMDTDKDTVLKDMELMRFRALNRGETVDM